MANGSGSRSIQVDLTFWVVLLIISFIWGSVFAVNHIVLKEIDIHSVVALRSILAAPLIWGLVLWRRSPLPRSPAVWLAACFLGILSLYVPNILVVWGQKFVPSGLAGILNASSVIFTMFFAAAILADEGLNRDRLIGGMIGFVGLIIILGIENILAFDPMSLGQLAIALSACVYGFSAVLVRRYLSLAPEVFVAIVITSTLLVSLPTTLYQSGMPSFEYTPLTWSGLIYLAVFPTFIAYVLMFRYLPRYGAGNLNLYCLLTGPVAIMLGALFFNERLSLQIYIGFALLLVGFLVIDGRLMRRMSGKIASERP